MSTGKPSVPAGYDEVAVDGIKVYMFKDAVAAPEGIKISLLVRWKFKFLQITGLLAG